MLQEGAGNETRLATAAKHYAPESYKIWTFGTNFWILHTLWSFDSCNNQKFDLTETFPENSKFTFVEILEHCAERKQFQNYLPGVKTSWLKDKILVCCISQSRIDLWVKYLAQKTSFENVQFWKSFED